MAAKLWTRDYALALVVSFFLSMVFYLLMTTMVLYAVHEFGAGEALAGLAASIYVVGALVARLAAGMAVDALGRRRVLLVSLVAFTLIAGAYFLANGLVMLLVLRFLHGVSFATAHTAVSAITQSLIPPQRRAEGTGYHGASTTLATAIGPFIAVLVLARGSYDGVILASTVAAFLGLCAALPLRAPSPATRVRPPSPATPPTPPTPAPPAIPPSSTKQPPRRPGPVEVRALPISAVALVGALGYSGVVAFANSYAVSLDLTSAAAAFFVVYALVVLVMRSFAGRLQDAYGDNVILYPAILSLSVGLVALGLTGSAPMLLIAAGLLGAGWGTLMSSGQAIAVGSAPMTNIGKTLSTYYLFVDLGIGAGPVLLGALVGATDYRTMYLVMAGVVLLNIGVYYVAHGRGVTRSRRARARVA